MKFPPAISLPARGSGELTPALACVALVALLVLQFALPQRTDLDVAGGRAPRFARDPTPVAAPEYPAILAAPVFSPSRTVGAAATPGQGEQGGTFEALGVGLGQGAATAILQLPGGEIVRARPGQVVQGWRVAAIQSTRVVLTRGGQRLSLTVGETAARRSEMRPGAGNDEDPTIEESE